jgi:single-stranded-DNA-specific exonuclease
MERRRLAQLREGLCEHAARFGSAVEPTRTVCDGRLKPSQLSPALLSELDRLGPFGNGNPEPVFEVAGLDVLDARVVGGSHLKMELKTPTGTISAFGPRMGAVASRAPRMVRVAVSVTADEWKGDGVPELRLVMPPVADDGISCGSGQAE